MALKEIQVSGVTITLDDFDKWKTTTVTRPNFPPQERGIIFYLDAGGKRKRIYCDPNEKAWKAAWMDLRDKLALGVQNSKKATLETVINEALAYRERFVGLSGPRGLREQSHKNDVRHLIKHVVPELGQKQITKITVGDINFFIDHLFIKGLAAKTQRQIIHSLNMVFKYSVDKGYIFNNPCSRDVRKKIEGNSSERDGYSLEEVTAILAQEMPLYSRALFTFSALTGLAANELQGLLWDAIDLKTGAVHVKRTGYRGGLQETKTEFRVRTIYMPARLMTLMREWHLNCPSQTFVFPSAKNVMAEQKHWFGLLRTICKNAGVEMKGIGGFRKFYHTQMELDGVPDSIRKYRMGHSKKSTTAQIHYTVTDIKKAQSVDDVARIEGRLFA